MTCMIDTMNLSKGTEMLLEELNFVATAEVVKPLPWRAVRSASPLRILYAALTLSRHSHSLPLDELNQLDRSSGRIDNDLTSRVLLTGTSSRTVDGVTLYAFAVVISSNLTADFYDL